MKTANLFLVFVLLLVWACRPVEQPEGGDVAITSIFPSAVYVNSPVISMRMLCNSFPDDALVTVNGVNVPVTAVYYGNYVRFDMPSVEEGTPSPLRVEIRNKQGNVLASREVGVRNDPLVLEHLDSQAIPSLALGRHPEYPNRGSPEDFDVLMRLNPDGSPIFHLLLGGYDASQEPLVHRLQYVSSNGPEGFGAPQPLPWGDAFEPTPLLTVDGQGVLHAAWNVRTVSDFNAMYTRSEDQGLHWAVPRKLTVPGTITRLLQFICTQDNHLVMAVCSSPVNSVMVAYAALSKDGGDTWHWAAIQNLKDSMSDTFSILEGRDGALFSCFYDDMQRVVVKTSRDGGVNWFSLFTTEESYPGGQFGVNPLRKRLFSGNFDRLFLTMGLEKNDYVRQVYETNFRAYLSISQNSGQTWAGRIRLDEALYDLSRFNFELLEEGDTLYVVSQDNSFVTVSYSRDQGHSWAPPQFMAVPKAVAKGDEQVSCPRAFIHEGRMYLFWRQNDGVRQARVRPNP